MRQECRVEAHPARVIPLVREPRKRGEDAFQRQSWKRARNGIARAQESAGPKQLVAKNNC